MKTTPYLILNCVLILIMVTMLVITITKTKTVKPAQHLLGALITSLFAFTVASIALLIGDFDIVRHLYILSTTGKYFIPAILIYFFMTTYNREERLNAGMAIAVFAIPVITLGFAVTNSLHNLYYSEFSWTESGTNAFISSAPGAVSWIAIAYTYVVGIFLIVFMVSDHIKLPLIKRSKSKLYLIALSLVVLVTVLQPLSRYGYYFDATTVGFAVSEMIVFYALFLYKPKRNKERIRNIALDFIESPVLIFGVNNRLLDANDIAMQKLGITQKDYNVLDVCEFIRVKLGIDDDSYDNLYEDADNIDGREVSLNGTDYFSVNDAVTHDEQSKYIGRVFVLKDMSRFKSTLDELEFTSSHDYLTSLLNKNYFYRYMLECDRPTMLPISIAYFNIINMKFLNNVYGYAYGDKAIKLVANTINKEAQKCGVTSRIKDDEFCLLMKSTTTDEANRIVDKIVSELKYSEEVSFTLACGTVTKTDEYTSIEDIMNEAIKRSKEAKAALYNVAHQNEVESLKRTLLQLELKTEKQMRMVVKLSYLLGRELNLSDKQLADLNLLSLLHDIGTISISDSITRRSGSLTNDEWEEKKMHTVRGYKLALSSTVLLPIAEDILSHHERWDGYGYPNRQKGELIPLNARIINIVDYYCGFAYSKNRKKKAMPVEALSATVRRAGTQFDPHLTEVFRKVMEAVI